MVHPRNSSGTKALLESGVLGVVRAVQPRSEVRVIGIGLTDLVRNIAISCELKESRSIYELK